MVGRARGAIIRFMYIFGVSDRLGGELRVDAFRLVSAGEQSVAN